MKHLYKYPQAAYPYDDIVATNAKRSRQEPEYELIDTGVFDDDRYFDVFVEYAKASPEDMLIQVTVANRGPEAATLHVLPTVWFRTENETNHERLHQAANRTPYVKDAFERYLVQGATDAVNSERTGTKAAAHHVVEVAGAETVTHFYEIQGP